MAGKKKIASGLPDDVQVTLMIYSASEGKNLCFSSIEDAKKSKDATVIAVVAALAE